MNANEVGDAEGAHEGDVDGGSLGGRDGGPEGPRDGERDDAGVLAGRIDALASHLVWRIGRASDDAPVTVRVGLASSAAAFRDLPRLKTASDAELRDAIDAGHVRVEWIGPKGR